jgi:hypothetical protein
VLMFLLIIPLPFSLGRGLSITLLPHRPPDDIQSSHGLEPLDLLGVVAVVYGDLVLVVFLLIHHTYQAIGKGYSLVFIVGE